MSKRDLEHLAKLKTHTISVRQPKMRQGKIVGGKVGKMGDFSPKTEGRDEFYRLGDHIINSSIVGAKEVKKGAPMHVREALARKARLEKLRKFRERIVGTEVCICEDTIARTIIPTQPLADCYSSAY